MTQANGKRHRLGDIIRCPPVLVMTSVYRSTVVVRRLPTLAMCCAHRLVIFRYELPASPFACTQQPVDVRRSSHANIAFGLYTIVNPRRGLLALYGQLTLDVVCPHCLWPI